MIIWAQNVTRVTGQSKITDAVIELQLHKHLFKFSLSLSYFWNLFRLFMTVLREENNVVYFVPSRSKFGMIKDIPIVLLALFGVKIIGHLHGSDSIKFLEHVRKLLLMGNAYLKIIFISPSAIVTKELSKKSYKCVTVENFHNAENSIQSNFVQGLSEKFLPKDQHLIVWNSNIMASKGIFEVLGAVEKLNNEGVNVHLCVFGLPISDTEMNADQARRRLGFYTSKSYISYLGPRGKQDIDVLLRQAQTVVLPSRYPTECQPLGLIEAMLQDCNVIISNRDVLLETVGVYENAIIVDPTTEGVYFGILKSINLPLRECNVATRERFSFARFSSEIQNLIENTYRN